MMGVTANRAINQIFHQAPTRKFIRIKGFSCTTLAPLPTNTCNEYHKIAENPGSDLSGVVLSGGPGFSSKIETPSSMILIPQCDQEGLYLPLQVRQNSQQFCVIPQTGKIAFDQSESKSTGGSGRSSRKDVLCQCFVGQTVISDHFIEFMPDCYATTGFDKLVQKYPDGKMQCYSPDGKAISEPFDPSPSDQLPA